MTVPLFVDSAIRVYEAATLSPVAPLPTAGGPLQEGDFVVFQHGPDVNQDTPITITPSGSGFVTIVPVTVADQASNTNSLQGAVHGKRITAAEADAAASGTLTGWTFNVSGTAAIDYSIISSRYRGVHATSPVDVGPAISALTEVNVDKTCPSVTTSTADTLALCGFHSRSSSYTTTQPSGWSLDGSTFPTVGARQGALASKAMPAAGATGDATWTVSNTGAIAILWTFALRPAPAVVTPPAVTSVEVGNVAGTAASAVIDLAASGDARLIVSTSATLSNPISGSLATGTHAKSTVTGLAPGVTYYWGVEVDGVVDADAQGSFLTDTPGGRGSFKVVVGGCSGNNTSPYITGAVSNAPTYLAMRDRGAQLWIDTGDRHYKDPGNVSVAQHVAYQQEVRAVTRRRALLETLAVDYSPDDHELTNNWTGATAGAGNLLAAIDQATPHYAWPVAGTFARTFTRARVRFISLDTRSKRASGTMLGTAQRDWCLDLLATATEKLVVLNVAVPWNGPSTETDAWGGYATSRAEIAAGITGARNRGVQVVLVCGDAHMVGIDDGTNTQYDSAASGVKGPALFSLNGIDANNSVKGGAFSHGTYSLSRYQFGELNIDDTAADGTLTITGTGYSTDVTSPDSPTVVQRMTLTVATVSDVATTTGTGARAATRVGSGTTAQVQGASVGAGTRTSTRAGVGATSQAQAGAAPQGARAITRTGVGATSQTQGASTGAGTRAASRAGIGSTTQVHPTVTAAGARAATRAGVGAVAQSSPTAGSGARAAFRAGTSAVTQNQPTTAAGARVATKAGSGVSDQASPTSTTGARTETRAGVGTSGQASPTTGTGARAITRAGSGTTLAAGATGSTGARTETRAGAGVSTQEQPPNTATGARAVSRSSVGTTNQEQPTTGAGVRAATRAGTGISASDTGTVGAGTRAVTRAEVATVDQQQTTASPGARAPTRAGIGVTTGPPVDPGQVATPADRTFHVPTENRTLTVPPDARTLIA